MGNDSKTDLEQDRFDRWLDSALQQYGDLEPRAGLENRILAHFDSVPRNNSNGAWKVALAAFSAACLLIGLWFGMPTHRAQRPVVAVTPTPALAVADSRRRTQPSRPAVHVAAHTKKRNLPRLEAAVNEPRLPQFPSPMPLTKEEQMLRRYVTEVPHEAVLVARAQAERQKELDALFARESSKSDSDQ